MVKSSAIEITFPPVCLSVCVCNACVLHINRGLLPESVYTTWYARASAVKVNSANIFATVFPRRVCCVGGCMKNLRLSTSILLYLVNDTR